MDKYLKLKVDHLKARKDKDVLASNLLGTFRSEVEDAFRTSSDTTDEVIEYIAKKFVKGLETVGTRDAKREMEILQPYLPETMTTKQIIDTLSGEGLEELDSFGAKMGRAMGLIGKRADGALVRQVIKDHFN